MSLPAPDPDLRLLTLLADIQRRLDALERGGQLGSASIGVTPSPASGSLSNKGLLILDGNRAERVRLGATDSDLATPSGAAGLYGVSARDTNGKVRAMFGQMVNAQGSTDYGAAAYDANGTVIWDTTGLKQTSVTTATYSLAAQAFTTTATILAAVSGATFTLTAASTTLLLIGQVNWYTTGGTASYGLVDMVLKNSSSSIVASAPSAVHTNGSGVSAASPVAVAYTLAPDTYTVSFRYYMDAGATTTWTSYSNQINVIKIGG